MKFLITRTANYDDTVCPCPDATLEDYLYTDERTIDDPEKNPFIAKTWFKDGINHRVEDGHIKRDFPIKGWFIEINTLEELLAFQSNMEYRLILSSAFYKYSIEIYDDYRE